MSKRHKGGDYMDPDLPITPMLDMSFQLLAFFVMTFQPTPVEGQIGLLLPRDETGEPRAVALSREERRAEHVVRVTATATGAIEAMTLLEDGAALPKDLGADVAKYRDALKALAARAGRLALRLEISDKLLQGHVVELMDVAVRVGFPSITPVPLDARRW